jgi:16S rRNA (cytosine967-C5)-methyltransferase
VPADPVRDAAVDVLLRVLDRQVHLDRSLDKTLRRKDVSDRGRRFLTQLVYGTVRHLGLCDYVLRPLLHQDSESLPSPIRTILRMGVYQGLFLEQVTRPAMVHTSVDLAKKRGHAGTAKLVNAVLKRVPQRLEDIVWPDPERDFPGYLAARYSLPRWIAELMVREFPPPPAPLPAGEGSPLERRGGEAEALAAACAVEAPITLRVNTLATTVESLHDALARAGSTSAKRTPVPEELTIESGGVPVRSKLLQEGSFLVQDAGSMLAAHLLDPQPGERVLDMCAAPGGKTTQLAAHAQNAAAIVANDLSRRRLKTVQENVARLGAHHIALLASDGRTPAVAPVFNRVLLDAPCTGLGTLRRHPDLKWRVQPRDVESLGRLQETLLRSAIGLCKNNGLIVYSVCTFTQRETHDVLQRILQTGDVTLDDGPEWMNRWKRERGLYQTLPHREGLDGFFLTRLRKRSST